MLIVNIKSRIIFLQIKSFRDHHEFSLSLSLSPRFSSTNFHRYLFSYDNFARI